MKFDFQTPTLGGLQFWTDYRIESEIRLQRNVLTDHWRVIDAHSMRRASGNRRTCEGVFDSLVDRVASKVHYEHVILLMHGLMRTSRSLRSMSAYLRQRLHRETISPSYASTRSSIAGHAAAFRSVVESLPGKPTIDLVAHSLGNIVIRHALADWERNGDPLQMLPQFRRMVMLGPPNQGALLARRLSKLGVFANVVGESGLQLGPQWQHLQDHLVVPKFPFAIVAGNMQGSVLAKNPLLDGESDLVVRVEETRLAGAAVEEHFPVLHSFLMNSPAVQKFVGDFLEAN